MSAASKTWVQMTLLEPRGCISSQVSGGGISRSASLGGLKTGPPGPDPVPVSPSAAPESGKASKTPATSGRTCSDSSMEPDPPSSLASRCQALLAGRGAPEYVLTWKVLDTTSTHSLCALRASVRRTSESGSTGELSGYPTPIANDATGSTHCYGPSKDGAERPRYLKLPGVARLAGWGPQAAQESSGTPEQAVDRKRQAREAGAEIGLSVTHLSHQVQMLSGATSTSSPFETARSGALNPSMSRWLMGYPEVWDIMAVEAHRSLKQKTKKR